MSDVCLHPELAELTGPLLPLASQARQVARALDAAPAPDDHVVEIDGEWYVRHPGRGRDRRRGSAGISADHWPTRDAALAAYAELTAHLAARAAALAGGVR